MLDKACTFQKNPPLHESFFFSFFLQMGLDEHLALGTITIEYNASHFLMVVIPEPASCFAISLWFRKNNQACALKDQVPTFCVEAHSTEPVD